MRPLVGGNQSHGHVEGGSLAGSVGAQQAYNLALLHVDGNVAYYGTLAILLYEVFVRSTILLSSSIRATYHCEGA